MNGPDRPAARRRFAMFAAATATLAVGLLVWGVFINPIAGGDGFYLSTQGLHVTDRACQGSTCHLTVADSPDPVICCSDAWATITWSSSALPTAPTGGPVDVRGDPCAEGHPQPGIVIGGVPAAYLGCTSSGVEVGPSYYGLEHAGVSYQISLYRPAGSPDVLQTWSWGAAINWPVIFGLILLALAVVIGAAPSLAHMQRR